MLHRSWEQRVADKDKEITRIAKERDHLQDIVLKKRLSTNDVKKKP